MTSNPDMLKYLDRLFLFVSGAQSFLIEYQQCVAPVSGGGTVRSLEALGERR